jgi:RecA-family ATPase
MTDIHPFGLMSRHDLQQWAMDNEHPSWFIPNLIPVDGVTIVYGDGGSGKSRILLEACLYLESGRPFLDSEHFHGDYVCTPVKTAWLSFEDAWAQEASARLADHPIQVDGPLFITRDSWQREPDIADRLRLSRSRDFIRDGIVDQNTESNWLMLGEALQSAGVQVLVVDATKGLVGGQVGRQEVADAVIELFAKLRRRYGVTVVLIAHASAHKKDFGKPSDEVMGASTWTHSARHVVLVQSNTSTTFARVHKSNWGPTGLNVQFERVSEAPLKLVQVTTQRQYVEEQAASRQQRDWETKRSQAQQALAAGPEAWKTQESLGKAAGGSKKIGQVLVKSMFFTKTPDGSGYQPNLELIGA